MAQSWFFLELTDNRTIWALYIEFYDIGNNGNDSRIKGEFFTIVTIPCCSTKEIRVYRRCFVCLVPRRCSVCCQTDYKNVPHKVIEVITSNRQKSLRAPPFGIFSWVYRIWSWEYRHLTNWLLFSGGLCLFFALLDRSSPNYVEYQNMSMVSTPKHQRFLLSSQFACGYFVVTKVTLYELSELLCRRFDSMTPYTPIPSFNLVGYDFT